MRVRTPLEIGALVRDRRTALGWSQEQLAEQIGATRQWVAALERGKPRAELGLTLRALNAVGVLLDAQTEHGRPVEDAGIVTHHPGFTRVNRALGVPRR